MKSLNTLVVCVLRDAGAQCGISVARDIDTVARRSKSEGEPFLTIALPTLGAAFERGLADGRFTPSMTSSFGCHRSLPRFLGGFFECVFDRATGLLLDDPSIDCIIAVRQITRFAGKIFEVCEPERARRSVDGFVECEHEMGEQWYDPTLLHGLGEACAKIFGAQLSRIDSKVADGSLIPRHGPGATADRLRGNAKFDNRYWTRRLDSVFPMADYLFPSYREWAAHQHQVHLVEPGDERPVRVVTVPKTATKARIIAIEPTAMQFAQQALLREFMSEFCDGAPFVDLRDQGRNRELARSGSCSGDLSTLDLSEASDRVGIDLVRAVFSHFPHLLEALEVTRSVRADVPGHGVIPLTKFASMGSAVCFPVESIVFATIALHAMVRQSNAGSPKSAEYLRFKESTRVFGDDIIVPTDMVQFVLRDLAYLGMRVNSHKSFWTGLFRESCGGEYYAGHDVTIFRARRRPPRGRQDAVELVSLVSLRNHAYQRGYWGTAREIDRWVRRIAPLPTVTPSSQVIGRHSVAFPFEVHRWDADLQIPLVRGMVTSAKAPASPVSGTGALLKCLLPGRDQPFHDADHLRYSGRPQSVRIKIGWAGVF